MAEVEDPVKAEKVEPVGKESDVMAGFLSMAAAKEESKEEDA